MNSLFNESDKNAIISRIQNLKEDNVRQWGVMNILQMLHHQTEAMQIALGEMEAEKVKMPFPNFMIRLMLFHMKWPKNSPTIPKIDQVKNPKPLKDFTEEKNDLVQVINTFYNLPADFQFPVHPVVGAMNRERWGKHQWRHVDWHLTQFSA
jgi:hypothetical protein